MGSCSLASAHPDPAGPRPSARRPTTPRRGLRPARPRSWPSAAALGLWLWAGPTLLGCGGGRQPLGPRETLTEYASALEAGRLAEAHALLAEEARRELPFEAFVRLAKEHPEELRELARSLRAPSSPPLVTATVTTPSGETLVLVYEDGAWRIDGSTLALYDQSTPERAVLSFVRAFRNERYDVLMRLVPDAELEGLTAAKLEKSWKGEQKAELEQLVAALETALPTAEVEIFGERATLGYGAGGTVELVRQHGQWKIEDF